MYYHCRPIKYVKYGKVFPPPDDSVDFMMPAYKWLSNYCGGYCPQVWLSRSHSVITGIRNKYAKDSILFGFDIVKGFPLSYDHWEVIMSVLLNEEKFEKQNKAIEDMFSSILGYCKEEKEEPEDVFADWVSSGCNLKVFLNKYLFIEKDQVVVPSLNLKVAKKIICRNEKQKKKLRKMGFIEDRILIQNINKE